MSRKINKFQLAIIILSGIYLLWRLLNLTILPIFADEAIYIRWSQLIISDWKQYLFFPLNDGKTPLQMWLMVPLLKVFKDQLFAGRLLSVLFGLGQVLMMIKMMSLFTTRKRWQLLAGIITILTPGLILTGRLALIDTQLTFFLAVSFYWAYKALEKMKADNEEKEERGAEKSQWKWKEILTPALFFSAGAFGLAMLTKFSAILFLPVLVTLLLYFWPTKFTWKKADWQLPIKMLLVLISIGFLGGCIFLLLAVHPAFPQLFSRGGDFLYSIKDFFVQPGQIINKNWLSFIETMSTYLTTVLFYFSIVLAIFFWPQDRRPMWLLISGLAFSAPMIILGQVIHGRYLLPALPFFILSFTLSLMYLRGKMGRLVKIVLLSLFLALGGYFTYNSVAAPAKMLLSRDDQIQYLQEWSSGYGIEETIALIEKLRSQKQTLVLTEGFFGTLPDALLAYYFNREVTNLKIEGIGQPIYNWEKYQDLIDQYPQAILVVNSHRMFAKLPSEKLLGNFSRPLPDSPSLQVWNLK